VTNSNPKHSLAYYAQRWQIEMLFAALKTTGFDEEPLDTVLIVK
jgi:IS4 transposase